jgi:hypothetical protein
MDSITNGWMYPTLIVWGVLTLVWMVLLGYRAVLISREDDQLFLAKGEASMAADQQVIISKLGRLSKPIWALGIVSIGMISTVIFVWLWHGMQTNP